MELIYKNKCVGEIVDVTIDMPEFWAKIIPNGNAVPLLECWYYITDEDSSYDDPPFDPEYYTDENYSIDIDGDIIPIYLPAIYPDGTISWRRRDFGALE